MKVGKKDIDLIEVGKLILLGTGVYILYKVFKKSPSEETADNIVKNQNQEINNLRRYYKQTYNDNYYLSLANQIYNSIAFSGIADNYQATFQLMMKPQNPLDMALLIRAYGVRQRYTLGIPSNFAEDLISSVSNELRSEVIYNPFTETKYDLLNKYYAEKNINYRV